MASEYTNTSFTGQTDILKDEETAQGEDTQTLAYESLQHANARELYETLETTTVTSTNEVHNKRCKVLRKSMIYVFLIILTATVIGTLTGVVFLFESTSRANGGWSDWGEWGTCTVTCGGGMQTRSRTCTNPRPSPRGEYCEGDPLEVVACHNITCSPNIVFKARNVTDTNPTTGQTIIFGMTLVNKGNSYNTSTGIFTAPVNGTYTFSTQFCVYHQTFMNIAIIVDGVTYATAYLYDKDSVTCDTTATVAVLHAQSEVWVKCTGADSGNVIHEADGYMNSFSGYLVH